MITRLTEMHFRQADCFNSKKIPLSRTRQRRMRSFTFMATLVLASAAMLVTTLSVPSTSAATLNGIVQTGGTCSTQPLAQAHVTLFEATTGQPTVIGQTTTDAFGRFSIQSPNNMSSSIFYVSADVGEGVEFLTVLGTRLQAAVTINELTTVAASYSMDPVLQDRCDLGKFLWPADRRRDERQHRHARDR